MLKVRLLLGCCLLALALTAGWMAARRMATPLAASTPPQLLTTPAVLRHIQVLSQYITVKYVVEKVVILEDVRWYGDNRVLLLAQGVVKAGLDLSQTQPEDVEIVGQQIRLRLPGPTITEAYLNDSATRVVERSTGMLRQFDKNLEQEARIRAVEEIQRAARYSGILEQARGNAEQQITALLEGLGYTVEIQH